MEAYGPRRRNQFCLRKGFSTRGTLRVSTTPYFADASGCLGFSENHMHALYGIQPLGLNSSPRESTWWRGCREVVSRNIDRARRGWYRSHFSPIAEEVGPLTLRDGAAFQIPSDDKLVPDLLPGSPPLNSPVEPLESPSES